MTSANLPFLLARVADEARRRGIFFDGELDPGHVAQIRAGGGSPRYFLPTEWDLNGIGSSSLARLKAWSLRLLQGGGVPVPDFELFGSGDPEGNPGSVPGPEAAFEYAERLGFPAVLRLHGQVRGAGARLVRDRAAMSRIVPELLAKDRMFLVQRWIRGTQFRVCVLDGSVIGAFELAPVTFLGDESRSAGEPSAAELLEHPETSGAIRDAGDCLSPASLAIARQAAYGSGLRLCVVDGVVPDADEQPAFWVLQVDGFCDLAACEALGEGPERAVAALLSECVQVRSPLGVSGISPRTVAPAGETGSGRSPALPALTTLAARVAEIAPALGVGVDRVPEHRDAIRLTYPDGTIRHVIDEMTDLNDPCSVTVARQKAWSAGFLQKGGFFLPEFQCFYADWLAQILGTNRDQAAALAYAEQLGFPVVCKPSAGLGGNGVFIAAGAEDFARFCSALVATEPIFLVQKAVFGLEYRVVVLDGQLEIAYEKHPLTVLGDGESSLSELIGKHLEAYRASSGHVGISADDFRITAHLAFLGRSRLDVVERGEELGVMLNSGYGCGGYLCEARHTVPEDVVAAAIAAASHMGLRYAGVDIKGPDPRGGAPYHLLEVNSMPDLTGYADLGPEQRFRVEGLIERLIVAMGRSQSFAV